LGAGAEASAIVVGQTISGRVAIADAAGRDDTKGAGDEAAAAGEEAAEWLDDGATGVETLELEPDEHPEIKTASANGAVSKDDLRPIAESSALMIAIE
jgi:hypothetical protein